MHLVLQVAHTCERCGSALRHCMRQAARVFTVSSLTCSTVDFVAAHCAHVQQPCRPSACTLGICASWHAAVVCAALQPASNRPQHVHSNQRAPAPGVSNDDASLCSRVHSPMSLTFALQADFTVFFTCSTCRLDVTEAWRQRTGTAGPAPQQVAVTCRSCRHMARYV